MLSEKSRHHSQLLLKVKPKEIDPEIEVEELPDEWWYRIYLAVIIATIVVISALSAFSHYFSS